MKILIPIFGFGKQGGYRVLSNLANSWIEMGHVVTFLSISDSITPYYPTIAQILWVDENGFVDKNSLLLHKRKFRFLKEIYSLYKGLNSLECHNFDVVLANQSHTTFPINFSHIKSLKAYYIQADEVEMQRIQGGLKNIILSAMSYLSYHFNLYRIVNSPLYLDYKYIKAKEFVLPAIDFKIFYPKKPISEQYHTKSIRLGCIGRKESFKGTQDVLESFNILRKDNIDVKLSIAFGDMNLNEISNVSVYFPANDSELADFYRSVDILIAPGTIQLGAVHYPVIEAMACGTSVVTTGYYPANDTNSWLVPVNNPLEIALTIKKILTGNLVNEKISKGIEDVKEMTWKNSSTKMINCFEKELQLQHK